MIIVSGFSGSGKTVALHTLEDMGYYCIDNLPVSLLPALYQEQKKMASPVAVGIDIRSYNDLGNSDVVKVIRQLKTEQTQTKLLFLTASDDVLTQRFSESRRKHPLSGKKSPLSDAIAAEKRILSPMLIDADFQIDTSKTSIYELKSRIKTWLAVEQDNQVLLTIKSFGFKPGVPIDADLMFDVRFLPNPYWEPKLRNFTGQDKPIGDYLAQYDECERFIADTTLYLTRWLPTYFDSFRTYLTIAIGCTGGKHRSVYISEQLKKRLEPQFGNIAVLHRDMPTTHKT